MQFLYKSAICLGENCHSCDSGLIIAVAPDAPASPIAMMLG
jgi:hypothetical protein